jgi:eukaryotic-like serine/threonine-protein kinase
MQPGITYEFGPFRLDPVKRTLHRGGDVVSIPPKAFDALVFLLSNRDRVVTKDELLDVLWPDVAVQESSLTQLIFLLRKALGDDPRDPSCIATVPRRGFRFSSPVQEHTTAEERGSRSRKWVAWSVAAAVFLIVLAGMGSFTWLRRQPVLTDRDQLLLAEFVNSTGDATFDGTLSHALAVQLDQSPFLSLVSRERVDETLQYMNRSTDVRLDVGVAREVCQRLGVRAMLAGSIATLGSRYVVGLEATACQSGETLAREQAQVSSREEVLDGLGRAVTRMRAQLGESLRSIDQFDVPLTQATTASLDALKAFSAGEERRAQGLEQEAITFYERALVLDRDFALAYARLNAIFGNLGEWERSAANGKEAFARQGRVSDRERFYIATGYYIAVDTNMDKYQQTLDLWSTAYPRDWYPKFAIADSYNALGQYTKGVRPALQALELNPENAIVYERVAETYEGLNRWSDAAAVLEAAVQAKRDSVGVHEHLFQIAMVQGDRAAADRHAHFASGTPDDEAMLETRADAAAFAGRLSESRKLRLMAEDLVRRQNYLESAAIIHSDQAVIESLCGDRRRAREWTTAALQISHAGIALGNAAEALANLGDIEPAERIRREQSSLGPPGGWLEPGVVATAALLELQRGEPSAALEMLRRMASMDLGRYTAFRVPYVRGLVYLALRNPTAAVAEFQKILDHRGIAPLSLLYPLAYVQQGRAYAFDGNFSKARHAYASFLEIWKDADEDVPILQEVRREYERLPVHEQMPHTSADRRVK